MNDVIKSLIYAEEFYAFRIHHKKGKVYDITSREFAWVSPFGVYVLQEVEGKRILEILNPALIEKITPLVRRFPGSPQDVQAQQMGPGQGWIMSVEQQGPRKKEKEKPE